MNQKLLDKNKPKELDWEKEFDKKFKIIYSPRFIGDKCNFEIKDFIQSLLTQQRTELLEEIKTRVDIFGGFEDDGGNLCHYDSEILEWVNDLLNKKNE